MKRILFVAILLLSLAVFLPSCVTPTYRPTTPALGVGLEYASAYYNRGNAWYDNGDYDKAISR